MADSFQPRFVDLVRNYTDTTGTQNLVLGAAVPGYEGFADALKAGDRFYYSVIAVESAQTEVGRGTLQADGTIAREPVNGTITDFGPGTKSVALVAGAEWFEGVQAGAGGSFSAASNRAELALADTSKPAILHEAGRAGLFVFDPGDRSADVSVDTLQGVYVAPASDPTGTSGAWARRYSGAIEARWFGATGDGVTDDTQAIQSALDFLDAGGGTAIRLGQGVFAISYVLMNGTPGLLFDARQATILGSIPDNFPTFNYWGAGTKIVGGTWKIVSGAVGTRHFDVVAPDCEIDGAEMIKEPEAGGYQAYIREDADRFTMRNCRSAGSNGFFQSGSGARYLNNRFTGPSVGGDDAIAIKATVDSVNDIKIVGNHFENLAFFCSIGSEIGTLGEDDPFYSLGVRNVIVAGNSGEACAGILFIKPGAISNYDYRDGTVEGVVVSDNVLRDETGANFSRGIAITAARGARVRNVSGRNNLIVARTSTAAAGRRVGALDIYIPDYSSLSTAQGPVISAIDIGIEFLDPNDGAIAGSAGLPGGPTNNIVAVEKQSAAYGSISNVTIDVKGNGCCFSGIVVQDGLDDAVSIRRAILTNVATDGSSSYGGIQYKSRVRAGNEISIGMAAGTAAKPYKPVAGGTADIVSHCDTIFVASSVPAGSDTTSRAVRWAAPRNAYVHKVEIVSSTNINKSVDDTNYTQHELRNENGTSVLVSANSKLTGGQNFPAQSFNAILQAANLAGSSLNDCFYGRGNRLSYTKNDFGTGNALTDASLRIHWAPF